LRSVLATQTLTRRQLARRVCEQFQWVNGAGQLKEMSCRVALLRLERAGLVQLPPVRRVPTLERPGTAEPIPRPEPPQMVAVDSGAALRVELVRSESGRRWYRSLMGQYHYLGAQPMAGAQLRYLLWSGEWLVGGLGFGAAAWLLAPRDRWIGWSDRQREQRLEWVVNNSRFVLVPWVRGPNLGSWVLGRLARQLPQDWYQRYGYAPVLLESFVDVERFEGTCYQAANWLCLGYTQGRGKLEKSGRSVLPRKRIFVRPLRADFRARLCG